MTDQAIIVEGNIITAIFLLIAFGIPVWLVLSGKSLIKAILNGWILFIVFMFILSTLIPGCLSAKYPEHKEAIFSVYPDGPIVAAALFIGWLFPLLFALSALLIRTVWLHFKKTKSTSDVIYNKRTL